MSNIPLKQIHFNGVTMQIPQVWNYETEEYNEEDGTKSYSIITRCRKERKDL